MEKITYLLGAGASANTIPVVGDMHQRITEVVGILESYKYPDNCSNVQPNRYSLFPDNLKSENATLLDIITELKWLLNEAEKYYSIDTLARKYYLTDDDISYERLKKCLIFYFTLEQFVFFESGIKNNNYNFEKNKIDKRYDSFISVIANKERYSLKLNTNIKILTWNYDIQFELSLKRFLKKEIQGLKSKYQILPPLYFRDEKIEHLHKKDEFSLIKLNGNAIFTTATSNENSFQTIFDAYHNQNYAEDRLLGILLDEWKNFDFHNNSACRFLNFAWEGKPDFIGRKYEAYPNLLIEAEKIASETNILVVIGYSFPIFNREMDNRLFKTMPNLKKVYVQDKDPDIIKSTMENAFEIFQKTESSATSGGGYNKEPIVKFHLTNNTNQFVIPYELFQD